MDSKAPWYQSTVNLDRYPILNLEDARTVAVIEKARTQLAQTGAAEMPDFLTATGLEQMITQSSHLENQAFWNALTGNAYLDEPESSLPQNHVRRLVESTSLGAVGYDQFPTDNLLRKIFEWDTFMAFLGEILRLPKMYRYADPMGALNLSVMKDGDYLRWHFDQTDFVASLSVRNATEGGEFEYVPLIRNSKAENYDRVRALLQGSREGVVHIENKPGTLLLFQGRNSIHRVTPIKGATSRLMGLFGYASQPGINSSEYLRKIRYGRTQPITKPV